MEAFAASTGRGKRSSSNDRANVAHRQRRSGIVAERVRGTPWERIGRALHTGAEEAEKTWAPKVRRWEERTRVQSDQVRDPGGYAFVVDNYAVTGLPPRRPAEPPQPLTPSLDAAASITGRDVADADRRFAGVRECAHCGCAA
ncbi:hypothetical protein ACFZBU_36565 [Embleya sp. NPDC008237]|uniref:hypothetical protein n=1 Tax=Embleya sp. NPDC008237 TaxID=3363978 RepID=UPI0036E7F8C2